MIKKYMGLITVIGCVLFLSSCTHLYPQSDILIESSDVELSPSLSTGDITTSNTDQAESSVILTEEAQTITGRPTEDILPSKSKPSIDPNLTDSAARASTSDILPSTNSTNSVITENSKKPDAAATKSEMSINSDSQKPTATADVHSCLLVLAILVILCIIILFVHSRI